MKTTVDIELMNNMAIIPTAGSEEAAGLDLYAAIPDKIVIAPHETKLIGTGLKIALPKGTFGGIFARSGLALKQGLRPANCVGVVDSDYRGEIGVALHNDSELERIVEPGERIAQLIIIPYVSAQFNKVNNIGETKRGINGFGSTGV